MVGAIDRLNLTRAVRKLPFGYKRLFLLYDVIGYEHSEIAGLLGCSTGCSKSQLHKARRRLRRLLQGEQGQQKHDLASAAGRDAAVTGIGPKRHPDVTYRSSGTAILQVANGPAEARRDSRGSCAMPRGFTRSPEDQMPSKSENKEKEISAQQLQ